MTRTSHDVDPRVDVESVHTLLQLALGCDVTTAPISWRAVLELAERERLLGVVWKESAEVVRRLAPSDVSAKWQRQSLLLGLHAERQLERLAEVVSALNSAAIEVVVLKGAPLAQWLYGDYTVRPSTDLDLYVPEASRAAARRILEAMGWHWMTGLGPEEETFERTDAEQLFRLEVHSSVLDDPLLEHIEFPVEHRGQPIGHVTLPMQSGRFVPAYLAAHLAKHHQKPLLWALDIFRLWTRLGDEERAEATAAASQVGLIRHLRWGISLANMVDATRGDDARGRSAVRDLMRVLATRDDAGRLIDLIALSSSPRAVLDVIAGRVWPAAWRRGWRAAPAYFVHRAVRWIYRRLVFERPSSNETASRENEVISLADRDGEERLVGALRRGPVWVTPPDGAMEPAIPFFGRARIVPIGRGTLRVNGVVVARGATGRCILQRVIGLAGDIVRLKSDTELGDERALPASALLGSCDLVDVDGHRVPILERPHGSLGILRAIVHAQLKTRAATRVL